MTIATRSNRPGSRATSSARPGRNSAGRLSTTVYPRSSKSLLVVVLPAPESPVITATCWVSAIDRVLAAGRHRPVQRTRRMLNSNSTYITTPSTLGLIGITAGRYDDRKDRDREDDHPPVLAQALGSDDPDLAEQDQDDRELHHETEGQEQHGHEAEVRLGGDQRLEHARHGEPQQKRRAANGRTT